MQFIVDFDYTLFNTAALREALQLAVSTHGISEERYRTTELSVKEEHGVYRFEEHLDRLSDDPGVRKELAALWGAVLQESASFIYPDAHSFLQQHEPERITVLSFGEPGWQELKISRSGVSDMVDQVYVTDGSKGDALVQFELSPGTVVITDRGSEIDQMHEADGRPEYVLLRRPGTPYASEPCEAFHREITSLDQL